MENNSRTIIVENDKIIVADLKNGITEITDKRTGEVYLYKSSEVLEMMKIAYRQNPVTA